MFKFIFFSQSLFQTLSCITNFSRTQFYCKSIFACLSSFYDGNSLRDSKKHHTASRLTADSASMMRPQKVRAEFEQKCAREMQIRDCSCIWKREREREREREAANIPTRVKKLRRVDARSRSEGLYDPKAQPTSSSPRWREIPRRSRERGYSVATLDDSGAHMKRHSTWLTATKLILRRTTPNML